jgi:hypothetical protein
MSASSETIIKLYQQYMPEMIENVIHIYEHYRNLKLPEGCAEYQVNRKRFDDVFWKGVIKEHIQHRYNPEQTIPFGRRICGGQMPWPDLIRRLPCMIAEDYKLQNKLSRMNTSPFSLGGFDDCDTPQKLETAIERWRQRNPQTSGPQVEAELCYELISRNWSFLLKDPNGRWLTASVLLRAIEQDGQEKLNKVVGSYLEEFVSQIV